MYEVFIENLTYESFLDRLNKGFETEDEFDKYVQEFFSKMEEKVISNVVSKTKIKESQNKIIEAARLKHGFHEMMELVDELRFKRSEHLDKIKYKDRYKGKYGKNTKRDTSSIEVKECIEHQAHEQLCIMWQDLR